MNNYDSAKSVAAWLKVIGWIIFIGGIIGSIYMGYSVPTVDEIMSSFSSYHRHEFNSVVFLIGSLSSVISGFLIIGFSEVINLLIGLNRNIVEAKEEIVRSVKEKESTPIETNRVFDEKLPPL